MQEAGVSPSFPLADPSPTQGRAQTPCPLDTSCQIPPGHPAPGIPGDKPAQASPAPPADSRVALVPSEALVRTSCPPSCHHHWLLPFLEAAAERPCSGVRSGDRTCWRQAGQLFPHPPAGFSPDSSRTQPAFSQSNLRQRESDPGTSSSGPCWLEDRPLKEAMYVKFSLAPFQAGPDKCEQLRAKGISDRPLMEPQVG